jgi:hypothetical protein
MENKITSHIVKGVILSAISIVFAVVMYVFNLYEKTYLSWISQGILFAGLIYSAILFANES